MALNKDENKKAAHLQKGELGESLACRYLLERGYVVRDRNYRKPYGEIDIVAELGGVVHFFEVKSVSCETILPKVTYGTKKDHQNGVYDPSDNVHPWKLKRLRRTIEAYLLERYRSDEPAWQLDALCVYLSDRERKARIVVLEDIDL